MPFIKNYLLSFLALFISAALLLGSVISLLILWQMHWDGPWRDMWEVMPWLQAAFVEKDFSSLWEHYGNSHRFYIAKLLWLADWHFTAGTNHFLIACSLICQLIVLLLIVAAMAKQHYSWRIQLPFIALVTFLLVGPAQLFNLFHTFDVQWFVVVACAVGSFYALSYGAPTKQKVLMVLCCCVLAGGNNFSGIIIIPVAIVLMSLRAYPLPWIAGFVIAITSYLLAYFHGLPADEGNVFAMAATADGVSALHYIVMLFIVLVKFPLTYLASPLSYMMQVDGPWRIENAFLAALPQLLVLGVLLMILRVVWQQWRKDSYTFFPLAIILFCIAVAGATSIGRAFHFDSAYAERFQNIVLLFWIGVALLLLLHWQQRGLAIALTLVTLFYGSAYAHQASGALIWANRTAVSHAALTAGITDRLNIIQATVSRFWFYTNPDGYTLNREMQFLADNKLAMHANWQWGKPTADQIATSKSCNKGLSEETITEVTVIHRGKGFFWQLYANAAVPMWFVYQNSKLKAMLPPVRSDYLWPWLKELIQPVARYEGFSTDELLPDVPVVIYGLHNGSWCYVTLNQWRLAEQ